MNETKICHRCGLEKPLKSFYVRKDSGYRNKSCNSCKSIHKLDILRERMSDYREHHREHTNLTAKLSHQKSRRERPESFMLYCARQRSKKRNLPFNITLNDIRVPETCPILGIPLVFSSRTTENQATDNSPSLDRIIPELGYVKGNIQVISKRANTIKSFGSVQEHERVVEYMKHNGCE